MIEYQHTQRGTVILVSIGLAAIVLGVQASRPGQRLVSIGIPIFLLVAVMFGSLTVSIGDGVLECRFGPGPVRKRFVMKEITGARVVRDPWYYGWGIRLTPQGWLYRVSGLEAVEITLQGGKKYRIGTDRPQELLAAIRNHVGSTADG
jgi:hypothetical protein